MRKHRKDFYYLSSRLFLVADSGRRETWISLDTYKDSRAYGRMVRGYESDAPVYAGFERLREEWAAFVVPGTGTVETWAGQSRLGL